MLGPACIYCGDVPYVRDHIPAVETAHLFSTQQYDHVVVPACISCNCVLSANAIPTIPERANYVLLMLYDKLTKAKHLNQIELVKQLQVRIENLDKVANGTMG
jgi:hypothetical protein